MPPVLSIIVPVYNEVNTIHPFYERLCAVMSPLSISWELICINDGSRDQTLSELLSLQQKDNRLSILDFSRNFGKEAALTAGLDWAQGEAVIPIDVDLQDPPELIPKMLEQWRSGFDVVLAVRSKREFDSWLKRLTACGFYGLLQHVSDVPIPKNAGDFRLMSRAVVEALKNLPERRRFMKGLFAWVGFRTTTITYERPERLTGKSKFNYWRLWNFAIEGITSFSTAPLRISTYLGFIVSILALINAIKIIFDTLLFGNPVRGYPSLMVAILFLAGIQLMALGVIGEYLGRLYEESKQRPIYIIRSVHQSPIQNNPVLVPPST